MKRSFSLYLFVLYTSAQKLMTMQIKKMAITAKMIAPDLFSLSIKDFLSIFLFYHRKPVRCYRNGKRRNRQLNSKEKQSIFIKEAHPKQWVRFHKFGKTPNRRKCRSSGQDLGGYFFLTYVCSEKPLFQNA